MFRHYGFREYAAPILDPVVGTLHRTLLVLDDLDNLSRANSPLSPSRGEEHTAGFSPMVDQLLTPTRLAMSASNLSRWAAINSNVHCRPLSKFDIHRTKFNWVTVPQGPSA